MVPQKEEMSMAKISTHGGQTAVVYCVQKNPIFFDLYGKIYPTVYTMWKYPDFLPLFTTWPPVFKKLAGGADLMLPGVVVKGQVTLSTFGKMAKGAMCAVSLVGNRAPVAVGNACLSGEDMYLSAMRGKGVEIVHILGDQLWEFGDQSSPPDLGDDVFTELLGEAQQDDSDGEAEEASVSQTAEVAQGVEDLTLDNCDPEPGGDNSGGATGGMEEESRDSVEVMDERLRTCCLCALKSKVKKSDLPLLTSAFFKNFMQPFCPAGQSLDVKKSSFKKLSKFLQHMQKQGLLKTKELSKGADSIVEIDKSHPGLKDVQVPDIVTEVPAPARQEGEYQPPKITEMFSVTSAVLPIFKSQGYNKSHALSAPDVRKEVTEYVKANNLQDEERKSHVLLDPDLAHILLTKQEGDLSHLKWDDLFSRVVDRMQPAFQLEFPGKPPVLRKGKIEPIKLSVEQRASNKKATIVDNLEDFGIDPAAFAHTVQKSVSCSSSVIPHHQKNKGMQVLVQGNQIAFIADLLLDKYKVPRKYVQGLEKAPKNKRR
ncbi:eukaryotic translation initiation factor 2D-like [Haliotis rubra]|uniref:eukaryotic translation initiation factor 2D-like n=1 Tax=Haliotis rubra TaxID=36100 RepID=UPI001EE56D00|nr:eukaryotic translation initiation factor 2D-like [Haliotis rubra]